MHGELAAPVHPVHPANEFFNYLEHQHQAVEPSQAVSGRAPLDSIKQALDKHHGNRRLAAEELGITERTLYRKLKLLQADD